MAGIPVWAYIVGALVVPAAGALGAVLARRTSRDEISLKRDDAAWTRLRELLDDVVEELDRVRSSSREQIASLTTELRRVTEEARRFERDLEDCRKGLP